MHGVIRFASIDDHPTISDALGAAAAATDDLHMVSAFTSIEAVPQPLRDRAHLDVVLLDLNLPGCRGMAAIREATSWGPKVLVFSATALIRQVDEALDCGADGFVSKALPTAAVLDSIRATYRGERPVSGVQVEPGPRVHLTDTESRLLDLICNDTRSAALAEALGVTPRTIDNMIAELYSKIGLDRKERSRATLRDWARTRGYGTG